MNVKHIKKKQKKQQHIIPSRVQTPSEIFLENCSLKYPDQPLNQKQIFWDPYPKIKHFKWKIYLQISDFSEKTLYCG